MAARKRPTTLAEEQKLYDTLTSPEVRDSPYRFAIACWDWGEPNTPLWNFKGPRVWQRDEMEAIEDHIKSNRERMELGLDPRVYKSASVTGRGTGKSALFSMLAWWFFTTRIGSTTVVTAYKEDQLRSKTFAELERWLSIAWNAHWQGTTGLKAAPAQWWQDEILKKLRIASGYYYIQGQLWSEESPGSFAGTHNPLGILQVFDEASGIADCIWDVAEGVYTEPVLDRYWLAFGNGRHNTGKFFECFHKDRNYWRIRNLDSRTVEGTDKEVLNDIIAKSGGEDTDVARTEVLGQFPQRGLDQFIGRHLIDAARFNPWTPIQELANRFAPLAMGVDPARFGDDSTTMYFRRGRDARSIAPVVLRGMDVMEVANRVAWEIDRHRPDVVCIDEGGMGAGVVDRLKERRYKVHGINFGTRANRPSAWADRRTEIWGAMRDWLPDGTIQEGNNKLIDDLNGPIFTIEPSGAVRLEPKKAMKKRGLASPDHGDGLALTFAVPVASAEARREREYDRGGRSRVARGTDYDPLNPGKPRERNPHRGIYRRGDV